MLSSFLNRIVLVVFLLALLAGLAAGQATDNNTPLTNAAVVKLVRAGFKEKTVISIVWARPPAFDLSPDRMIELKRSGLSEKIILAMLSRQQGLAFDDESWTNDSLFDQNNKQKEKSGAGSKEGSTDIFGSSGSSRGRTQQSGAGDSSASGDTETTGSATVRIIRPPAEAGATPKLEKVSSLTNDSIIELVEAGFSEGTIIRRIEKSPVEFDLSPAKLADLRKHRVTDKILAAMKAAMGEESRTSTTGPISNGTPKPN